MSLENNIREDSLIKEYRLLENKGVQTHKIIFTTVKDNELTYYTNSERFLESLEKLSGDTFVITYFKAESSKVTKGSKAPKNSKVKGEEERIVRVKLPKSKE